MSVAGGNGEPAAPGKIDTLEVVRDTQADTPPHQPAVPDDEEDVYEDASDAGEVFIRRVVAQPPKGRMPDLPLPVYLW